jgi:signal transduction histidine kinase
MTDFPAAVVCNLADDTKSQVPPSDPAILQRQLSDCQATLRALQHEQELLSQGMSHDLRAPLRAIDNFCRLIDASDSLDSATRDQLQRVRGASLRMGRLIDALLELSRVGRVELRHEAVDLGALVELVGEELQDAQPQRHAELHIAPDVHVQGDERLLKVLIRQLLDNAWRFSHERDCVRMHVRAEPLTGELNDERLEISVRDEGSGFDMRHAQKLFEPFQRLHSASQGGGSGMGLAIAQRIVQRHGGRLQCTSETGVGSTFRFDLPAALQPA